MSLDYWIKIRLIQLFNYYIIIRILKILKFHKCKGTGWFPFPIFSSFEVALV